jgi:stress response protein YsnF
MAGSGYEDEAVPDRLLERHPCQVEHDSGAVEHAAGERTVEVHQTTEEPVVSKTAHIAEEVVVRKDTTERTETVRDDVRREEVEVKNPNRPNP